MRMTHQQSSEPLFGEQVTKIEPADLKAPAENGAYVHGLYLEGAAWSKKEGKLVDSAPKVPLLSK
jgi:dynein heavy chain, axonemal